MNRVDPIDLLRFFHRIDVGDIDDHGLVVGAHEDAFEDVVRIGVDFLVGHIRRHEDEVARIGFGGEFEPVAPTHARLAADDENHTFQSAVMMHPRLGVGRDFDCPGPDLLRADAGMIDRHLAEHSRRLRRIRIELIALDDPHAIVLPT
ncbi:MAG: hypothetical protein K0Q70_186 [Rhodospirillales bacterium]|nr:hypothetical protein [Rhodospirillales bacterium]